MSAVKFGWVCASASESWSPVVRLSRGGALRGLSFPVSEVSAPPQQAPKARGGAGRLCSLSCAARVSAFFSESRPRSPARGRPVVTRRQPRHGRKCRDHPGRWLLGAPPGCAEPDECAGAPGSVLFLPSAFADVEPAKRRKAHGRCVARRPWSPSVPRSSGASWCRLARNVSPQIGAFRAPVWCVRRPRGAPQGQRAQSPEPRPGYHGANRRSLGGARAEKGRPAVPASLGSRRRPEFSI